MIKYLLISFFLIRNVFSCVMQDSTSNDTLKIETKEDTLSAEIPDTLTITAKEVIDKYIAAIGGKDKLYNIVDRTTTLIGSVQGINITIISYQKAPNKIKQKIKAGSNEQVIIFDGERGVMRMAGEQQEITGTELEKLKFESTLTLLNDIGHYEIELSLEGIEKINDKEIYKIIMTLPSGIKWTQYYDVESGLKLKEAKYINSPAGLLQQEIFYYDYREVEGILYPHKITQTLGAQTMEFTVSSIEINSGLVDREFEIE